MKKLPIYFLISFLFACGGGSSGTGGSVEYRTVKGKLITESEAPISDIDVEVEGSDLSEKSNEDGSFDFEIAKDFGDRLILAFYIDGEKFEVTLDLLKDKELVEIICTYYPDSDEILIEEVYYE